MLVQHPHDIRLPTFSKPEIKVSVSESQSPKSIAQAWLDKFSFVLASGDVSRIASVVHEDSWWRDFLTLTWDFHTIRGVQKMTEFLLTNIEGAQFSGLKLQENGQFAPSLQTPIDGLDWVESMFHFETKFGRGKGMLRLAQGGDGAWKAHFIYTALQELKGNEEFVGARRPHGGNNSLEGGAIKGNWLDRRERRKDFIDEDPTVFIVGAGQSGLNMGARLQALGISCLLVDKNARIGDNWRNRYRTLVTHDPVQYTHMAYLPFPSNWPLFTPKDKLGDWFEAYASLMELNVWVSTTITKATYSDVEKKWNMTVKRGDGTERTLHPKHVIFCTGHAGEPKIPTFPGQDTFKGTIYHGSQHKDASIYKGDLSGKKVVVVGTGNSGHDIAQNYYEAGAGPVTMLQRRGTYVIQASKGLFMLHEGLYDETGPPTEDADIYSQSLPIPVQFALNVDGTKHIAEVEKENLEGLTKAGFKIDFGHDGSGIYRKYITRGGGYYIDVGCSQLIIDGKVKVEQSPEGIKGFEPNALVLADGRKLDADIVVLATGYDNMRTSVQKALGDEVASRCKDVWDLDDEGEVNAMWRPSGHPRLWFFGGSLALCRIYSRFLALQIKAIEEGLSSP
ncbi:putative flavin-containing monooxygenase YUCCA3 [Lindgomyces ingoldianus]|uniref:Flavin-containing monooxygenase YUCCA3 n=1 Tax=Lindgomyces ingoldianus TaxID=673940 RepID=A0ACB6RAD6_9PLEO|nr:putative flavin-containing monooxygenase YUCCA3 [Lindgomyces ingoldianus]KAF2476283.1 putative flavin-containing monooxygenase YUCCA3 [Lindgomyces ingoldianus]